MDKFSVKDKTGRIIRMPWKQWGHLIKKHSDMSNYIEEIKETLRNPLKITDYSFYEDVRYYYKFLKNRNSPFKYILVIVKYLNGEGFIITSYFEKQIK